ncbi:TIGR03085 family metal-binding protein [Microbispora triticiradicis]|uniref:TIGR03085 family metal-binding protein n=1 Tax=Microbispora triticiradicis TaxID=2200763 RepID=UPI001AD7CD1D|nr:TIGR03085 family metal-binding protein [Microbispora triticiradicis]MBO4272635.1 TIGR03085 family protein [Microbispora triticiradicis]
MTHAQTERAALCDLLDDLGPGAPTLCEGWATEDLTAHLVLRERRLDAAPGIALPLLAGHTAAVQERLTRRHSYPELVGLVRNGPPRWTPYGLVPRLDEIVNTVELFVHHEDVRRAQPGWEPRELPEDLQEAFWRRLRGGARFFMRGAPVGVVLRRTDGARTAGRMAEPAVVVTGEPAELLLFAFGRQEHARVTYQGDDQAVARLRQARFGL